MKRISLTEFRVHAAALDGAVLNTRHRKCPFLLTVEPTGLTYTPQSTGYPRPQPWHYVERLLDRYNETGSFTPSEYHDLTVNASYFLAVLQAVLHPPPCS